MENKSFEKESISESRNSFVLTSVPPSDSDQVIAGQENVSKETPNSTKQDTTESLSQQIEKAISDNIEQSNVKRERLLTEQ